MTPDRIAAIARALSNPTRVELLRVIAARGPLNCTQVCERFPLSQPTMSHHISALAEAGLIRVRKQGPFHELRADRRAMTAFTKSLAVPARKAGAAKKG